MQSLIAPSVYCYYSYLFSACDCVCPQMTASKDFVVHMVATPALSSEVGNSDLPCRRWLSIEAVDEQYITNHARQVQMLFVDVRVVWCGM